MNDEIKEILDLLNFNRDTISNRTCCVEDFMSRDEIIKLLDYITNLQKENEELKDQKKKAINILKNSASNKGLCTRPETDTIQCVLEILGGDE